VETLINRRNFLRGAAATSAVLMATRAARAFDSKRHFAPVRVARDRVIREVVGLRPYRPSGFVVDAERLGHKLLVHNYGHGGGGVTLSWGTASLAVDLARDFSSRTSQLDPRVSLYSAAASVDSRPHACCNAVFRMVQAQ
jgi:glycine/D-amino acid oxidase-like deaminating enzyme